MGLWEFYILRFKASGESLVESLMQCIAKQWNTNISSIPMVWYFGFSPCGIYINKWISVLLTSWKHDASEALQRWLTLDVAVKTCQSLESFSTAAMHGLMFKYLARVLLFTVCFPFTQRECRVNVPCADWVYVIRCFRITIM